MERGWAQNFVLIALYILREGPLSQARAKLSAALCILDALQNCDLCFDKTLFLFLLLYVQVILCA